MITWKLHKRLLSFTLLVSLISFSGIAHEQVKPTSAITKMHASDCISSIASSYFAKFQIYNSNLKSPSYCIFNFKQFLLGQNELLTQNLRVQVIIGFESKTDFRSFHFKLLSTIDTEDFLNVNLV